MTENASSKERQKPAKKSGGREDRLKAALKANMGRRKAQKRARDSSETDKSP
jgi:hypothetical protein